MPATLWHYTTARGMQGILSSEHMWFTDTRFLNDAAEIQYGIDFFVEQLKLVDLSAYKPKTAEILEKLNKQDWTTFRANLATKSSAYVACFCAQGDLLSQWRTYGV